MKFFNLRSRNPNLVGVEIGTSTLKVIGLGASREGPALYFYSIINLPKDSSAAYITEAIQKALKDNNFASRNAVLTFSDDSITIRRMELPRVASNEIIDAVKWQAKDYIRFNIDDGSLDYKLLGEVQKEDGSKVTDLMLAAAPKAAMDKKIQILKAASLN